jgi:hypothetical protein
MCYGNFFFFSFCFVFFIFWDFSKKSEDLRGFLELTTPKKNCLHIVSCYVQFSFLTELLTGNVLIIFLSVRYLLSVKFCTWRGYFSPCFPLLP